MMFRCASFNREPRKCELARFGKLPCMYSEGHCRLHHPAVSLKESSVAAVTEQDVQGIAVNSEDECIAGLEDITAPVFTQLESRAALSVRKPPYGLGPLPSNGEVLENVYRTTRMPSQIRFGTCAVVGNSGVLMQQSLGEEIDAHEAVIRVNGAPREKRWAQQVGVRSTWHVISSAFMPPINANK